MMCVYIDTCRYLLPGRHLSKARNLVTFVGGCLEGVVGGWWLAGNCVGCSDGNVCDSGPGCCTGLPNESLEIDLVGDPNSDNSLLTVEAGDDNIECSVCVCVCVCACVCVRVYRSR